MTGQRWIWVGVGEGRRYLILSITEKIRQKDEKHWQNRVEKNKEKLNWLALAEKKQSDRWWLFIQLASFCLGRHWVCALVVIPCSSCNGDCGCRAQSASGRSSCRSGTQRLCRPRYPMLPSLVCAASSSRVALSVSVLFWPLQILWSTSKHFGQQPRLQGR